MSETNTVQPAETGVPVPAPAPNGAPAGDLPPDHLEQQRLKLRAIRRKRNTKRIVASVVVIALIVGMVFAVYEVFFKPETPYYKTDIVRRVEKLERSIQGYGSVKPMDSQVISAQIKGSVLMADGYPGMPVEEGQVLCVLDGAEIDKQIEALNKDIETENARIKKAEEEIGKIDKQMQEENADIYEQIQNATLTAPFSGKALEVTKVTIGSRVEQGAGLGLLVIDDTMILRQHFSYGYIGDIKTGMSVSVSIPSVMTVQTGTVTGVETARNIHTDGTITFEVEITLKNPGSLTKDMPASSSITLSSGEVALPTASGALEYSREEVLSVGASGNMKVYALRNNYEYTAGTLLASVDYVPDESRLEGFKTAIQGQQDIIDTANAVIAEKNTAIAEADATRAELTVVAPMSGTLMNYNAMPGMMMEAGAEICTVARMTTVLIDATVSQQDLESIQVGMPIMLTMDGQTDLGVKATVKYISPQGQGDQNQGGRGNVYYPFVIEADNSEGLLMNSYGVSYLVILEQSLNPLVVPVDAVKPLLSGQCVYVKRDERPENAIDLQDADMPEGFYAVPVEIGISQQMIIENNYKDVVEIKSGLEEGDVVCTHKLPTKPSPTPSPSVEPSDEDEASPSPDDGGEVVPDDGGEVLPDDGGAVVPDDGGAVVPDDGGEIVPDDGGEIVPDDGKAVDGGVIVDGGDGAVVVQPPRPLR